MKRKSSQTIAVKGYRDPIKDIFSVESQTTESDVQGIEHDTYPFRESQILFFDDVYIHTTTISISEEKKIYLLLMLQD